MTQPGRLGAFVMGGYSYLGYGSSEVIEPYPILHVKPVLIEKPVGQGADGRAVISVQKVNDYSKPLSLHLEDVPAGVFNIAWSTPFPVMLGSVGLTFRVNAETRYQAMRLTVVAQDSGGEVARAFVPVAVSPPGYFFVVDGWNLPVVEQGLANSIEVIGDKERARDGTMQSTVRAVKRSWSFSLQLRDASTYSAYARYLFSDLNRRRILSGDIVPREAVPVVITPKDPEHVLVGGETLMRLRGHLEEV